MILCWKKGTPTIIDSLNFNGENISNNSVVRNLGFHFDEFLTLNSHISKTVQTVHFHLKTISRVRHLLDPESTKLMINALVTSRLDYCNSLMFGLPKYSIERLQKLQNKAARLVVQHPSTSSSAPMLKRLHWLPVAARIEFKTACLVHKCLFSTTSPEYLNNLITLYNPVRSLRSSNTNLLVTKQNDLSTNY